MTSLKCPVCLEVLAASERLGIEIDTCPRCRGVWLDRGELDKLLQREAADSRSRHGGHDDDDRDFRRRDRDDYPHRRRSMWSELFD